VPSSAPIGGGAQVAGSAFWAGFCWKRKDTILQIKALAAMQHCGLWIQAELYVAASKQAM
jgi:hypothetical protein